MSDLSPAMNVVAGGMIVLFFVTLFYQLKNLCREENRKKNP